MNLQSIVDLVIDLPELQAPVALAVANGIKALKPDAAEQKAAKDLLTAIAANL